MRKFKLLILAALMSFAFMMTGCSDGSSVDTTLQFDKTLTGTRTMTLAINNSVFAENFNGTFDDLDALISGTCPDSLTWNHGKSEDHDVYTFVLSFSGAEDYRNKVNALLGGEHELTMEVADGLWSNGARVNEDFTSVDLLQWLKNAIVAAEYVSEDNAGRIFAMGNNTIMFNGDERRAYGNLSMDTMEYLSISGMDILTEILDVENYKQTWVVDVPKKSMDAKGEEIEAYMKEITPTGCTLEKDDSSGSNTVFTFTCNMTNMTGLQSQLETFLGQGHAVLTKNTEASANPSPFRYAIKMDQTLNFSNFVPTEYTRMIVSYWVKMPAGFALDYNSFHYYDTIDSKYPEYTRIFNSGVSSEDEEFPVYLSKAFTIAKMEVETEYKGNDKWARTTAFYIKETPTKEELAEMANNFSDRAAAIGQEASANTSDAEEAEETKEDDKQAKASVKVSSKTKDGVSYITVKQKGTSDEMADGSKALFGDKSVLTFAKETGALKIKKDEAIVDSFRYGSVVGEVDSEFTLNYTLKVSGINSMNYNNVPEENLVSAKGSKLVADFNKVYGTVQWYGSYTDILAVIAVALFVVGGILVAFAILKGLLGGKKTEAAVANETTVAPVAEEKVVAEETPKETFCKNCGTKLAPGAAFCPECGTKVE